MSALPGLSHSARYALAAMVVLGKLPEPDRISAMDLAHQAGVPDAFLAKLLRQLGRAGIVEGLKGHHGGYRLARPASQIRLIDVLTGLEETDHAVHTECALGARPCNPQHPCTLHHRWSAAVRPMTDLLHQMTVADLTTNSSADGSPA